MGEIAVGGTGHQWRKKRSRQSHGTNRVVGDSHVYPLGSLQSLKEVGVTLLESQQNANK
jgi:hypothetical protein